MILKRRLMFSNTANIAIPVLITVIASFVFIFISSSFLDRDINYDNIKKIIEIRAELFNAENSELQKDPELLLKKDYQEYVVAKLSNIKAELIILKKHESVFATKSMSQIDLEKCLNAVNSGILSKAVQLNGIDYLISVFSVTFKDGVSGSIILLAPIGRNGIVTENFILFILIMFLFSFLVVNLISSLIFSKSLLKPLMGLKLAAGEISAGNLNYAMHEEGDDEIRELCSSFEQMRLKLKNSVHTQMKYDDNRKMLVSSISHDIKTPITSIKGYVEGILDGVANTPDKMEKYLKTVYSKAVQVDAMIDELLLFSKLDLKQIPFNFEKTDIVKYLSDCIFENEVELERFGIKIALKNQLPHSSFVLIDREQMTRVMNNILDNAKKYMNKQNGEITILLRETKSSIITEIQDNGAGIAKEDLLYIFDRFYRADTARSNMHGSGLGLTIAKQIIEGQEGKIWVRSDKDYGTSIMISLNKIE